MEMWIELARGEDCRQLQCSVEEFVGSFCRRWLREHILRALQLASRRHAFAWLSAIVESSSYCSIMASHEAHHLFHNPIADHSFSADRKTLAVARDNNVELYNRSGNSFQLKDELRGHDKTVTGVDIALQSGRIVTCSQGIICLKTTALLSQKLIFPPRPQCLRLGTFSLRMEAHSRPPSPQPCCNLCPLVASRNQIRRWLRRPRRRRL